MAETGGLVRIEAKMNGAKNREILDENLLQSAQDLRLGRRFTSNRTTTLSTQQRQRRSGFGTSLRKSLNPIEQLSRDLTIAVYQMICTEEWEKLPKYKCAKTVSSH